MKQRAPNHLQAGKIYFKSMRNGQDTYREVPNKAAFHAFANSPEQGTFCRCEDDPRVGKVITELRAQEALDELPN